MTKKTRELREKEGEKSYYWRQKKTYRERERIRETEIINIEKEIE